MSIFYDLFISILDVLIKFSSLYNEKNKKIIEGRKLSLKKVKEFKLNNKEAIWLHVSSVGEFEQAKPIIDSIKQNYKFKIAVSYFSSSAERIVDNYSNVDYSFYLPSDKKKLMKELFENFTPKILILIKYEFWKNLIEQAKINSIPILSISSVFRKKQIFFFPGIFFKNILKNISLFLVQNENSFDLLKKINIKNVKVVGDTRYDRVLEIVKKTDEIENVKNFIDNKNAIVIGSSWKSDIDKLKNEILKDLTDTKYIIVPHNINSKEFEFLENTFINDTIRYSDLPQNNVNKRILIIDKFGILSSIYRYGKIAYIGGAFRGALHNTLEAAAWNIPVIYGYNKNNVKFIEVDELEKNKIGFPIKNGNEFRLIKNRIFNNSKIGKGGFNFIEKKSGATKKINFYISDYLK